MKKIAIVLFLSLSLLFTSNSNLNAQTIHSFGNMVKSVYDANNDGVVDEAETLSSSDTSRATITTQNISKTVGSDGDYSTIQDAFNDLPNLIAHTVTFTIKKGTYTDTLDTTSLKAITTTPNGRIIVQAEKYLDEIGTATGADATYLEDTTKSWTINEWQGCWVFIVDGTGTDNGMVEITSNDATKLYVSSWPGTQPDNTSRFMISGVKYDYGNIYTGWKFKYWQSKTVIKGIFFNSSNNNSYPIVAHLVIPESTSPDFQVLHCGFWKGNRAFTTVGVNDNFSPSSVALRVEYCGAVGQSLRSYEIRMNGVIAHIGYSAVSDSVYGIYVTEGSHVKMKDCFGSNNTLYGVEVNNRSAGQYQGTIPSGNSANSHADNSSWFGFGYY
ncbi:MAG: hypothetical protein JRI44_00275 [Deltaproteobacteria bacterium]|nr:hypothetical protein [Deltaproteobacteria bacterium]